MIGTSIVGSRPLPRRAVLAACCLGMSTLCYGATVAATCQTAIAAELGMTRYAEGGAFLSAAVWGVVLAILVVGPLADRVGFRALLAGSAVFQSVGLLLISRAGSPGAAMLGGFVVGVGAGTADALLTPVVCALYPARRTAASNLLHAFFPIGLVVAVSLVLLLVQLDWGWRAICATFSVLALPYGLLMVFLPLPRQSHEGAERLPTRRIVRDGSFLLLALFIFLAGATEFGPFAWLPTLVEKLAGGGKAARVQGGGGLVLFGATMALGRLATLGLVGRVGARRLLVGGGLLCAAGLLLSALPVGPVWTMGWLGVLGLAVAGFWPTLLGLAGDRFPAAGASMFSVLSAFGNIGCGVGPATIGLAADRLGLSAAMPLLAVAPLLAALVASRMRMGPSPPRLTTDMGAVRLAGRANPSCRQPG